MANKNEAKIKFTAETGGFNSAIKKANDEMSELRAELKLNEAQMKTTGTTVEGLEQKHKILSSQLQASENKTEALNQKVNKAIEIYGENSTEVSKLRTQLLNAQTAEEKIKQAINACNSELEQQKNASDQAADETKELGDNLVNASEGAGEATESFTVLKGAMADLVSEGIQKVAEGLVNIGTSAFETANEIDQATNTFIAKTGQSADAGEEFEAIMVDIYNGNYGESFEDIAESMATVKTSLGDLSDSELQELTTDALVLRDTFDMDVNESIRAVNSLMDQFGISADEAFSLVAQGAQNGLNQNGDLLDVINEYSVQFKGAGYSAEDMFNMLANGVEAGTWSVDKLGDAVKEFNIRMSDGSAKEAVEALGFSWESVSAEWSKGGDSAKEVFNMLFNELDGLENTTEGYGIGVGLLGTMYEDLGQDAVLALSNTQGEISKSKDALEEINSIKYDDMGSALDGIKRNLQTAISEPMQNNVMPAVNEFIENVDWQGTGQLIGDAFGVIAEGAVAMATGIKDAVQWMSEHKGVTIALASIIGILTVALTAYNIAQGIKTAMDTAEVTTVWALVAAHWAQATAAMAALAPYILVVAAIAAVIAIIVLCIKYWDEIVAACKKCWEALKETLSVWGEWINENVIQPVVNWFKQLWQSIKNIFSGIKNTASNTWNGIKNTISNAVTNVKNTVSSIWDSIKSKTSSVFNSVKSTATSVWNGIKSAIMKPIETAKNTVVKAIDKIKSAFKFDWSLPKPKLPKFSVSGGKAPWGFMGKGSLPKVSIEWYAKGGILTKPTIFGMNGTNFMGGGEAGAEAILPIDRLEGYIVGAIEKTMQVADAQSIVEAVADLANRPIVLNVNGRNFATATASDTDSVNGLRTTFKNRGLVLG